MRRTEDGSLNRDLYGEFPDPRLLESGLGKKRLYFRYIVRSFSIWLRCKIMIHILRSRLTSYKYYSYSKCKYLVNRPDSRYALIELLFSRSILTIFFESIGKKNQRCTLITSRVKGQVLGHLSQYSAIF